MSCQTAADTTPSGHQASRRPSLLDSQNVRIGCPTTHPHIPSRYYSSHTLLQTHTHIHKPRLKLSLTHYHRLCLTRLRCCLLLRASDRPFLPIIHYPIIISRKSSINMQTNHLSLPQTISLHFSLLYMIPLTAQDTHHSALSTLLIHTKHDHA